MALNKPRLQHQSSHQEFSWRLCFLILKLETIINRFGPRAWHRAMIPQTFLLLWDNRSKPTHINSTTTTHWSRCPQRHFQANRFWRLTISEWMWPPDYTLKLVCICSIAMSLCRWTLSMIMPTLCKESREVILMLWISRSHQETTL